MALQLIREIPALRARVSAWRRAGLKVALVPTMGSLHEGHFGLIRLAREHADRVVASIFVNPTQFGPAEDFERYPRTPEADADGLQAAGCDVLFLPSTADMYPLGVEQAVRVEVPGLSDILCGASRPGHFAGVATVVTRLLNMAQPDVAVFGSKDYQQLRVVQHLVRDLAMPVEVLAAPTARAADGLALSSRNRYLDSSQRRLAPEIHRTLQFMCNRARAGDPVEGIESGARQRLGGFGFEVDYAALRSVDLQAPDLQQAEWVALIAARLGSTRLIDNLRFALAAGKDASARETSSGL